MDLREVTNNKNRHPWESARLKALVTILQMYAEPRQDKAVLDVGCGDAYTTSRLFEKGHVKSIDAIDIHLTEDQAMGMSNSSNCISFYNRYESLKKNFYDFVLALDVMEHVADDKLFLTNIVGKFMKPEGYILITVPAYQFLFSSQDKFLGHHRRYRLDDLMRVVRSAELESEAYGYLFLSLMPIRFISKFFELLFPGKRRQNKGIGHWKHGKLITKCIEIALITENSISLNLNRYGIKLPGLSLWALCKKPQSSFPVITKQKDYV